MLERAVELEPGKQELASNLLLALHYVRRWNAGEMFELHRAWGERFATGLGDHPTVAVRADDRDRPMRVGFISGDLREHPVGNYLASVLVGRDRARAHVTCYSNLGRADLITQRVRELSDDWQEIRGISDAEVAQRIRQDRIDVLVDLGGHTAGNGLLVMARRPAAVMVTQFAYPDTTGLSAINWRITDGIADPAGTERYSVEKLWRMKRLAWCWSPPEIAVDVSEAPCARTGLVTFGSLNNAAKINDALLGVWAAILREVEGSRLMLTIPPAGEGRVRKIISEHGVDGRRIECVGRMSRVEYFRKHGQIDVALDPLPYNGAITTCDALWMGLPVVTLAGDSYASRQGVAIMETVGLTELVARDEANYIRIAVELACNPQKLTALRARLRAMIETSAVCDTDGYSRELFEAYGQMLVLQRA